MKESHIFNVRENPKILLHRQSDGAPMPTRSGRNLVGWTIHPKQGCVQSRKKLAKLAFLVLGLVEWSKLAPPYRVIKIVKRLQHLPIEIPIEKIF